MWVGVVQRRICHRKQIISIDMRHSILLRRYCILISPESVAFSASPSNGRFGPPPPFLFSFSLLIKTSDTLER